MLLIFDAIFLRPALAIGFQIASQRVGVPTNPCRLKALRDQADQPVLQTLLAAKAQYLITGDKDLLASADRYPIVTPADFWTRHGA
jgi:predicted nucleic acid-binding protein